MSYTVNRSNLFPDLPQRQWIARSRHIGCAGCLGREYGTTQGGPFTWLPPVTTA